MKINEILVEDDFYPTITDNTRTEEELQTFLDQYVENTLGAPHQASTHRDMGVIVSIPSRIHRPGNAKQDAYMKDEWRDTAVDLIDELRIAEFGDYELEALTSRYIELEKKHLNETTTAGGIATVSGGLAPAFTRNASIYGTKSSKKKKKSAKYANSANKE